MIQPHKKGVERKDSVMKVIIKGGSEDTNTYYYSVDPQAPSVLSNESILSDLNKLMQLDSYESRKNNAEIAHLQTEVKQTGAVLEKVLGLCDDETKTSG